MARITRKQIFEVTAPQDLVEVLDSSHNSLMLMQRQQVLQQGLAHRRVLVLLRDQDNRAFIRQTEDPQSRKFLWSVSAQGFQKAGDSLEDTAARLAESQLGESGLSLRFAAAYGPVEQTGSARVFLFVSQPSRLLMELVGPAGAGPDPQNGGRATGMLVDRDELAGMIAAMPELMHPALIWAASSTDIFAAPAGAGRPVRQPS